MRAWYGSNARAPRSLKSTRPIVSRPPGAIFLLALGLGVAVPCRTSQVADHQDTAADPWSSTQVVEPAALVKELGTTSKSRALVVYVGFDFLYQAAHLPDALFYGPARESAGLQRLKTAAQNWPRDRDIVIYCGCCPFNHCPNVRPAFEALKAMGFTRLRVLHIENDFRSDWLKQGYPVEKSLPPTK